MSVSSRTQARPPISERQWVRRGELLEAARRVFERDGYHATTVSAIVQAARLSQGAFYLYFADKKAVFAALQEEMGTLLRRRIYWATREEAQPGARLEAGLRAYFEYYGEYRDWNHRMTIEGLGIDPGFERRQLELYGALSSGFRETLEELNVAEPEFAAAALIGIASQVADWNHREPSSRSRRSPAQLAQACASLFLRGAPSVTTLRSQGGIHA